MSICAFAFSLFDNERMVERSKTLGISATTKSNMWKKETGGLL